MFSHTSTTHNILFKHLAAFPHRSVKQPICERRLKVGWPSWDFKHTTPGLTTSIATEAQQRFRKMEWNFFAGIVYNKQIINTVTQSNALYHASWTLPDITHHTRRRLV